MNYGINMSVSIEAEGDNPRQAADRAANKLQDALEKAGITVTLIIIQRVEQAAS